MSHTIGILLALVSIAVTTCKALPDFHKQMSPQQLQSIFHVDDPDAVPHYEVIQLLHHNNQEPANHHYNHYRRRKRSIETIQHLQEHNSSKNSNSKKLETHHVKKDLSKNPYYSELKSDTLKSTHKNSVYDDDETKKPSIKDIKEHKVSLKAFGKDLNLTLKQTQSLFKNGHVHRLPMWFVDNETNATHGLNLQKIQDEHTHTSEAIGEVFQDEENMAAILMRRHEVTGDLVMEGSIGHDMVIKPLPHDLIPNQKEAQHVIFKREADISEHLSDFAFMEPDDLATSEKLEKLQNRHKRSAHRTTLDDIELEEELLEAEDGIVNDEFVSHKRPKRQAPYIIYPEILVIVDYDGYRLHGGDNLQVKRYFISFWNGVDLRYRLLKGPRIRISIAGIIISRGRDATPYLERNRVGRDAIDSAAALTDMGKYLFRERRLPVYDIAVAITKYDMCRRRKGGRCTKGTAGFAYVGGACVVNKRLEKVNSVAIIEDTGGFSGIIVAAHEVGHLLGAVHDGSPPPSYLGGPGAQRCRWEDGYIMSDLRHTERGFRWSPCTVQSFHHFLNGDTATCLHNAPHEDSALGRSLPGTLLSLDAQCRRDRGTYACFKDERVCAQLFCFDAQTGYCVAYRPAAEGSSCGNSLHCLDGRCTPLPSNVIPNYGHQYRLGYKSNEAISDDIVSESKELQNSSMDTKEEEENVSSEEELEEDDDDDEEDNDEEDEEEEEVDNINSNMETTKKNLNNNNNNYHDNHDDDEQYLNEQTSDDDENNNNSSTKELRNLDNNHIDLRSDNNVDETMLNRNDNEQNTLQFTQNPLININTYQYLAQLWQNLQQSTLTTTTTTTKKPLLATKPENIQLQSKGQGYVVVKTSTKTSVSSSSESKRNNLTTTPTTNYILQPQYHTTKPQQSQHNTIITPTTNTPTTNPTSTTTLLKSLRKQFQYYIKLLQENNSNINNSRNNHNLNNNNYNSKTILPSKPYSNSVNNAASPSAATNDDSNSNNNNDEEDDEDNDEDNGNGGEDNDESNETIEKQKRKLSIPLTTKILQQQQLKASTNPTTAMPATTTLSSNANTQRYGSKTSSITSTATQRNLPTPTFFETYFKKLQILNNNNENQNQNNKPLAATSVATTTTELPLTYEKNSKLINNKNHDTENDNAKVNEHNVHNDDEKSVTSFEAQFLKRTLNPSTKEKGDDDSSSFSLQTNNPYFKNFQTKKKKSIINTTTSRSTTSSSSSSINNNSNFQKTLDDLDNFNTTPQQSPVYVTNYIGDNTQRLTSIVQQHQPQLQQQHQQQPQELQLHQQQQATSATTTSLQQQDQEQQHNSHQQFPNSPSPHQQQNQQQFESLIFSTTTRRPKIKTQKLIRRLRTQIK